MKTRQFKRILTQAGCYVVRHGKRHDLWFSPVTGLVDAVPRHDVQEVPTGLFEKLSKNLLGK